MNKTDRILYYSFAFKTLDRNTFYLLYSTANCLSISYISSIYQRSDRDTLLFHYSSGKNIQCFFFLIDISNWWWLSISILVFFFRVSINWRRKSKRNKNNNFNRQCFQNVTKKSLFSSLQDFRLALKFNFICPSCLFFLHSFKCDKAF